MRAERQKHAAKANTRVNFSPSIHILLFINIISGHPIFAHHQNMSPYNPVGHFTALQAGGSLHSDGVIASTAAGIASRSQRPLPGRDLHSLEHFAFARRTWATIALIMKFSASTIIWNGIATTPLYTISSAHEEQQAYHIPSDPIGPYGTARRFAPDDRWNAPDGSKSRRLYPRIPAVGH